MSLDPKEFATRALCGLPMLLFCLEAYYRATWNAIYFTTGWPVLTLRIPVHFHHGDPHPPCAAALEDSQHADWTGSFVFRKIDRQTFAFRLKDFPYPFLPLFSLLHGTLFFDRERRRVVVKGYPDVLVIYLAVVALLFADLNHTVPVALAVFVALAVTSLFGIEYYRYSRVAAAAAAAWTQRDQPVRRARREFWAAHGT